MSFFNTLAAWQWAVLLAVPPAIVALYFLKLRRQPLEVPSTLLWHKSIEDLQVNRPWQRIRQSLLLYLQLLTVALAIVALLRPGWRSREPLGQRSILLIDNSESMSATDVHPSRLDEAKRRAVALIDQMQNDDLAMVVSFSDAAHIERSFTESRADLRQAVQNIQPTNRPTDIADALRLASSLGNSDDRAETGEESSPAPQAAKLFILSDGKFPAAPNVTLGNVEPEFVSTAASHPENIGIVAFNVDRSESASKKLQAYGRIENFSDQQTSVPVDLFRDGKNIDAATLNIPAHDSAGVSFTLSEPEPGMLELRLATSDALSQDDRAWAAINPARRAKVMLITPENQPLELALSTPRAHELAEVDIAAPDVLQTKAHQRQAADGTYDLVIYDRCTPAQMPQANTLFVAAAPPRSDESSWSLGDPVAVPQIVDSARNHPLMQWLDMSNVEIAEARPVTPPSGGRRLLDSNKGVLLGIAPRDEFEDAVLGFAIYTTDPKGQPLANTNWPIRRSFPTFVYALLEYFGGRHATMAAAASKPGQPIAWKTDRSSDELEVRTPSGTTVAVSRSPSGSFHFNATDELGPYEVIDHGNVAQRFAVNLFDAAESDIRPPQENSLQIGQLTVPAMATDATARREIWKWLLAAALVVLLAEWYIYNRRVYL